MPDTGAPWNIPYVESTDLVSDWPTDSLALANAIDSGLDAAGGLVAVKHALFTGTQTNSTATGANFAVTDLTITHTLADAANKLIISAYVNLGSSASEVETAMAVADDGTLIAIGDAAGSRTRVGAGGRPTTAGVGGSAVINNLSMCFVYEPGDTNSHTFTVRAVNPNGSTRTITVNRTSGDTDDAFNTRSSSSLVIQEVKV